MKSNKAFAMWILVAAVTAPVAFASGGSSAPKSTPSSITETKSLTPDEQAMAHYNQGIALRDRAESLQAKLEAMTEGSKRAKIEKKVGKAWKGAINEFTQAVQKNPMHYQAYSSLGYSLRKTGNYDASLNAYGSALNIEPNYTEAIEYRAEAYLGLNRVDDAKAAYAQLIERNQNHATELLEAMKSWVEMRKNDPAGVTAQTVNDLDRWIEQHAASMGDTIGHAMPGQPRRW